MHRALFSLLLYGAVAYGLLVLLMFVMQSRMLYLPGIPGRALVASPADLDLRYEEITLSTADGIDLHAWYVPAGNARLTVLFLHGNAGNISHRLEWLEILNQAGLNVLLVDYRGYGQSEGRPTEEGTHLDALAAWDHLRERGFRPDEIILFGESLGGAVAARLARETSPAGLILFSAFTSVPDIAAWHYPYLPVRLLSRFSYATVDHLPRIEAPVMIMHSPDDEIVPFAHAHELLRAANEPRVFLQTAGDHNTGFILSASLIREGIRAFVATHVDDERDYSQKIQSRMQPRMIR